ncbi:MAG: hypothetical protein QM485_00065 [Flavobacteriaceae bacterium]
MKNNTISYRVAQSLLSIRLCTLTFLISIQSIFAQLDVQVEDHSGFDRKMWPVTGGIPFPKGIVFNVDSIGIANTPSQTRVLSRWEDGSVKWALFDYQSDIDANKKAINQVIFSDTLSNHESFVKETDLEIIVNTGVLKFSVSKLKFSFLDQVWLDLNYNEMFEPDELIVKSDSGQDHFLDFQLNNPDRPTTPYTIRNLKTGTTRPVINGQPTVKGGPRWIRPEGGGSEIRKRASEGNYSAEIVEQGPLRTVIQLKGRLGTSDDDSEYSIWIHAYKGKSFLRVQHNFMFRGDPQIANIRRIGLELPLNFESPQKFSASGLSKQEELKKGGNAYLFNTGPHDVFHLEHKGFPLDWEVGIGKKTIQGTEKTDGWIDVSSDKFGVTLSIKDMAYKYPKELSYLSENNSLNAWMWPDHGGLVLDLRASGWPKGMQGMSFTHDIFYSFHGPQDEKQYKAFAAAINDVPQPYVNPEWYSYKGTKAAGMIMPLDDVKFPKTEAFLATGTTFIERSAIEFGWLGLLNYGDMMFMYAYQKEDRDLGTWGISSRNDDYDGWRRGNTMISYRKFIQYLRTGEYRYWKAASSHLTFVRDVLIKHYNSDDSRYIGFGRRHSAYWGATPRDESDRLGGVAWDGYGTNWLGHYLHWNLTGDWRTYEVIDEIRSAWNEWGDNLNIDQLSGGAYVGLKTISGIPGYEQSEREADKFLVSAIDRTANPGDQWRDNTWFMGYGVYLQDMEDPIITEAILDWWKAGDHNIDKWGLYWHRDAVSAVYWAAKNDTEIRDNVYKELSTIGSTESMDNARIKAQNALYKTYGILGLFDCDIVSLANAVTAGRNKAHKGYWRAKDDIMQQQWDEPLGMAVIDHYRENKGDDMSQEKVKKGWFDVAIDTTNSNFNIAVTLEKLSTFELDILNKAGEIIWQFKQDEKREGIIHVPWTHINEPDKKNSQNIYFLRLLVGDERKIKKITLK